MQASEPLDNVSRGTLSHVYDITVIKSSLSLVDDVVFEQRLGFSKV